MIVNSDDNYFHERAIKQSNQMTTVIAKNTGQEGLTYLKLQKTNQYLHPDLIFLDINIAKHEWPGNFFNNMHNWKTNYNSAQSSSCSQHLKMQRT